MTKFYRLLILFIVLLSLQANYQVIAQTGTSRDIRSLLDEYCINVPWEEMFAHTDRDVYTAGEEIWFNAYLLDRKSGKLSSRSKIAYFELLNPDNVPVVQKRLLINEGVCPGNAHLPDTLTPGIYTFRIYTNWMKNFLPENAFMKNITIVNPFRTNGFSGKTIYDKLLPASINLEFYPEGGTLLNGIKNKIAVKVSDEYQRGIVYNGIVKDRSGNEVATFTSDRYGLALFELTPSAGNSYYVLHAGTITYLPMALDEGCSLNADYIGKELVTITISENRSLSTSGNQVYTLLIQSNGDVKYYDSFRIQGNSKIIVISKQGLAEGINQITLFNQNLNPLCERLIYIDPHNASDELEIVLSDRYQRREKVTININQLKGTDVSLSNSAMSISVIPLSYRMNYRELDDYLVFGTQFGYLPWDNNERSAGEVGEGEFDNFLLTAKSRWIVWNKVFDMNKAQLNFRMEEEVHFLSGLIKERETNVSETGKSLTLSIPGKVASYFHTYTDDAGHFSFMLPADQIQRDLIIQPGSEDDNFSVEIDPSYSRDLPLSVSYKDSVPENISILFSDMGARYQVSRIFETSIKEEVEPDLSETEPVKRFYGKPDQELLMEDYISLPVMQEVFFELVPGVRLRERRSGYEMKIVNPYTGYYYDDLATVMIDGVVINDLKALADLDPEIVEKIDIIKTPYLTGDFVHSGIIHVITRSGNFNNLTLPDNAIKMPYRVTDPVSLFSPPDYSGSGNKQTRIPDFRNTLYWNPSVKLQEGGKSSVEFWTSDLAGKYLVDLQGITTEGNKVSFRKVITVY
jgi:hypothetical protein